MSSDILQNFAECLYSANLADETAAQQTACRNAGPQAADTPPKQTQTATQDKPDKQQKQIDWGDDEDWVRPRTDYSSYGKFKITPDTPAGEL